MQPNRRFSLLALPQFFDGTNLGLNIVVLPRNQNPLKPAIEQNVTIPDAPAFAEAELRFEAKIISGLTGFPNSLAATDTQSLTTLAPTNAVDLFTSLGKQFDIAKPDQTNEDLDSNLDSVKATTPAVAPEASVKKYLPQTYRKAFNFTTARTENAVTDDSYHCAVRNAEKVPGFERSPEQISWGKIFAYALRQPLLAGQLGMIYQTQLTVHADHFPDGGWLYVDLAADSDYKAQQQADDSFIAKYAARIPTLKLGEQRQVFAPMLIPVLFKAHSGDPDPVRNGNYDQILIETADYDDGFAKIVHAFQPSSLNLLAEQSDGAHPVKDVGIRLGWDDEQILIWYMRQMMIDTSVTPTPINLEKRIDAPLTVFGYAIDVRETAVPENPWESLNGVQSKTVLSIPRDKSPGAELLSLGGFAGELPFQVYPAQLDGDQTKNYWLPMYFANWNGHNMVLPDEDAANIYQTNNVNVKADPITPTTGTGVKGPAQNQLNKIYDADPISTNLRYGRRYDFRVRLRDLSGGGPANNPGIVPIHDTPSNTGHCHFKRYVTPHQVRLQDLPVNNDAAATLPKLRVRRPLLGYPAVIYAGKYANPIAALKQASLDMVGTEAFGIEDPDVDRVEITVEVQTLKMDNLLSVTGKENYAFLYRTARAFPKVNNEADYKKVLEIPIVYKDCKVLHVGDEVDVATDLNLPGSIDDLEEIVLPTARTIRLTLRALCEHKANDADYYGLVNPSDPEKDTRLGRILQVRVYEKSNDETELFVNTSVAQRLQGIYLQPDAPALLDGSIVSFLVGKEVEKPADIVQRLANQLKLANIGLTLTGRKGERVQFGCSNRIRHVLSPENSSLTFSSKGDLANHWLVGISLDLDRDWTWDALEDRSLVFARTLRFTHDDPLTETETAEVGDIEIRHTASFEALQTPQRDYTRLIFIDAVEPKNQRMQAPPNAKQPRFPDTIELTYAVAASFKADHGAEHDGDEHLDLSLPITTPPAQIPRLASAGIALSPYRRNDKYSATEPRQRFLWIEFDEPIRDPDDAYFARVLAYAPDQLISNNHPELLAAPEEPALPIDPEQIRVIAPGASNDLAGLDAMQPMEKAADSDRHYLLPFPPGLHADAPEMFGFFTYEFRVGHYRNEDTGDMVWCTAQGRFGRPLRASGVQHPAPTLTCAVNRDEEKLYVVAPYAIAALNGKDYTADPPRTQLWCLLYAQVRQADNKDFRNILLDDKKLDPRVQIEPDKQVNWLTRYDAQQRVTLKNITIRNWKDELEYANLRHIFKLADTSESNKDATKYGTVAWSNNEVEQLLTLYGLPRNSPLSVLVVEILPVITNLREHVSKAHTSKVAASLQERLPMVDLQLATGARIAVVSESVTVDREQASPLSDELGHHRILRTSPLTEVPFVC